MVGGADDCGGHHGLKRKNQFSCITGMHRPLTCSYNHVEEDEPEALQEIVNNRAVDNIVEALNVGCAARGMCITSQNVEIEEVACACNG